MHKKAEGLDFREDLQLKNSIPCSGGSRNVRKGGGGADVAQPSPAGGLGGAVSPPTGSGAEPRRQTHFGNNLLKIG